jgi:cell division septum initiation protein DivIVA
MTDYLDEMAQLRAEVQYLAQCEAQSNAEQEREAAVECEKAAADAMIQGDRESARMHIQDADYHAARYVEEAAKLPPPPLSQKKQEWIARRGDLNNNVNAKLAHWAHNKLTREMGVQDDSDQYYELMSHVLEPPNYQPFPSPDDICRELKLDPNEYNRQVQRLWNLKASGQYNT